MIEEIGLDFVGSVWWWVWVSLILVLSRQWGGFGSGYGGEGDFRAMYLSCGAHVRWRHQYGYITWHQLT